MVIVQITAMVLGCEMLKQLHLEECPLPGEIDKNRDNEKHPRGLSSSGRTPVTLYRPSMVSSQGLETVFGSGLASVPT